MTGFFGWFASGFKVLFLRTPGWAKKVIKSLSNMYSLQLKEMKMGIVGGAGKKKKTGILGALGLLLGMSVAAFAAWLKAKFMAISLLWKGFKLTGLFKLIKLRTIGFFSKMARFVEVLKKLPIIGRIIGAFKAGLKLGWLLNIVFAFIDFMKGFREKEGTLFEKIKAGLWAAIEGFIELPVKFFGWVVEKVAGLFGVELEGVSNRIMGWIKKIYDFIGDFIGKGLSGIGSLSVDLYSKWSGMLMSAIEPIVAGVANFFIDFWNSAVEWIQSKIPDWLPGSDKITSGLESTQISRIEPLDKKEKSPVEKISDLDAEKIKAEKVRNQKSLKTQEELLNEQKKARKDSNQANTAIHNVMANQQTNGGNTSELQQIPDELDNYALSFLNFTGEF
jgi:hypothetical protein